MTPRALKKCTEWTAPDFFTSRVMDFYGDSMANYGVREATINGIDAWELYRKKTVYYGIKRSHYFRKDNYKLICKE